MKIAIRYRFQVIDRGWVVWRRTGTGPETAVRVTGQVDHFRDRRQAEDAVGTQSRADKAAASRLGVDVDITVMR